MQRNYYQTQTNFNFNPYSSMRQTSASVFGQRAPLYPIGPTLPKPEHKEMARGIPISPYLKQEERRKPSYQERYLSKAQALQSQNNINYAERERRLIQRNQIQIEEEKKRRDQISVSYQRQINSLSAALNRNIEKKQKLLTEIQSLQSTHDQLHDKLMSQTPPQKKFDEFEPIDRKQQQMIILKNKLITNMRESETELNKKQEQEEKYWQEQISEKEKILFKLQQNLRDKRLELHMQKQKTLEKPDLLSLEEQVRASKYEQFIDQYQELEKKIKFLVEERQKSGKQVRDMLQIKKPQLHNLNIRRAEVKRQHTELKLRVEELSRVTKQMEAANSNLIKQLQRKEQMISKYEIDIFDLRSLKESTQSEISTILTGARQQSQEHIFNTLKDVISKVQEDIRFEQSSTIKLKNQYQKLYQLLCSATSKHIHQTFARTVTSSS